MPFLGPFVLGVLLAGGQPPPASSTVHGVVTGPSGLPVAGATVRVEPNPDCRATTSADGAFTLPCAHPGDVLRVEATGARPAAVAAVEGATAITLELTQFTEAVVVTATRGDARTTSPAAPVSVLTSADLALAPPVPLDDVLRVVPGFSLFRRTTSRSANPTAQGAGLRGLSASGASRALVLADGEPLNDPFGGWVYWNRVPQTAIDRVEVVRGGGSDLYGADALVGVLQVVTRRPRAPMLRAEGALATRESGRVSLFGGSAHGPWSFSGGGEVFTTEGYILVAESDRGAVDTPAGGEYASLRADAAYSAGGALTGRVGGDVFGERRENGTPLQTNSTDLRQLRLAVDGAGRGFTWRLSGQVGDQTYRQVFSSIAETRATETLTVQQRVPASQHGVAFTLQRRVGDVDLLAGADMRETSATNVERGFFPDGRLRAVTTTPGFQRTSGVFAQATMSPASSVTVSVGARGDARQGERGEGLFDRDGAFSPRAVVTWALQPSIVARGSIGWSFRAPTLNERFRGFRVGNVVTQPNPELVPEQLRTVEGGFAWLPRRGALRVTVFRNDLDDAVTNVTVTSTPALITRRRQNVGGIAAWGSETEGEWRLSSRATLTGALALTRSRFVDYAPLEGLLVPQVPRWQGTIGLRGAGPLGLALAGQLRAFGEQFEDDRNTLALGAGAVVDVSVLKAVGSRSTVFVNVENLFDDAYEVGRTPVATYGQPATLHVGVRLALP